MFTMNKIESPKRQDETSFINSTFVKEDHSENLNKSVVVHRDVARRRDHSN
jgi:hypothetical protein